VDVEATRALIIERYQLRTRGRVVSSLSSSSSLSLQSTSAGAAGDEGEESGLVRESVARFGRDLGAINALLDTATQQTDRMVSILTEFGARLTALEQSSRAITDDTLRLKNAHANIDAAMRQVGKTLDMFATAAKLEARVRAGPSSATLTDFFALMDKLAEAEAFLAEHRTFVSAPDALQQLREVRATAVTGCEQHFVSLLKKYSGPVDPTKPVLPGEGPHGSVEPRVLEDLKRIVRKLATGSGKGCATEYAALRSKFIVGSLGKMVPEKIPSAWTMVARMAMYTRGTHPLTPLLRAGLELIKHERELAEEVLEKQLEDVWALVVTPALKLLADTGDATLKAQRGVGGTFGLLIVTDLHNELRNLLPEFDSATRLTKKGPNPYMTEIKAMDEKYEAALIKWFAEFEEGL
jgi:hypothetical protein